MRIGVEHNAYVGVSHQILKDFRVHSALCHIGTIGVAADVRSDFGKRRSVYAVVFLADALEKPSNGSFLMIFRTKL